MAVPTPYDNVCTLPLTSEIFAQAVHPSNPIFAVGLTSGHVEAYRLPSLSDDPIATNSQSNGFITSLPKSALSDRSRRNSGGRRDSLNGFGTLNSIWRTKRHVASCRALEFSHDGETLYSAGADGVLKAAMTETGRVLDKLVVRHNGYGILCDLSFSDNLQGQEHTTSSYTYPRNLPKSSPCRY